MTQRILLVKFNDNIGSQNLREFWRHKILKQLELKQPIVCSHARTLFLLSTFNIFWLRKTSMTVSDIRQIVRISLTDLQKGKAWHIIIYKELDSSFMRINEEQSNIIIIFAL